MKGTSSWSYRPYKPLLYDTGDIYICRIAPGKNEIHLEWLACGGECSVYFRKRGEEHFALAGKASACEYTLAGLARPAPVISTSSPNNGNDNAV